MKIDVYDITMILFIPLMYVMNIFNLFNIFHVILLSSAYGAYVMLRVYTSFQRKMAIKRGLLSELDRINKLEKRAKRWIK